MFRWVHCNEKSFFVQSPYFSESMISIGPTTDKFISPRISISNIAEFIMSCFLRRNKSGSFCNCRNCLQFILNAMKSPLNTFLFVQLLLLIGMCSIIIWINPLRDDGIFNVTPTKDSSSSINYQVILHHNFIPIQWTEVGHLFHLSCNFLLNFFSLRLRLSSIFFFLYFIAADNIYFKLK